MDPEELLHPAVDPTLPRVRAPRLDVRDPAAAALAAVVVDPAGAAVPIVPWPVRGGRPLDTGTGTGGGSTEGSFTSAWDGERLLATNAAVDGRYVIGLGGPAPTTVLLWHLNHHPDGGQLFWSPTGDPFVVPAAPAGVDPDPHRVVALWSDGTVGICLRPEVWHDGVYPLSGGSGGHSGTFATRQGAVHARVSADVATEFGVLVEVDLRRDP